MELIRGFDKNDQSLRQVRQNKEGNEHKQDKLFRLRIFKREDIQTDWMLFQPNNILSRKNMVL